MEIRKNTQKTTSKATSNLPDINISSKNKNTVKKLAKRSGLKVIAIAFFVFIFGALLGAGAWWLVCRNDCFELNGNEYVSLTLSEKYEDEGVNIIAFGKNESKNITIETNLQIDNDGNLYSDEVGTYYIKYISQSFKYNKLFNVQKVRIIEIVENSEGGDSDGN